METKTADGARRRFGGWQRFWRRFGGWQRFWRRLEDGRDLEAVWSVERLGLVEVGLEDEILSK